MNAGSRYLCLFAFALFFGLIAEAGLRLPALVSNGMVLQQESRVCIWGWGNPGTGVSLRFSSGRGESEPFSTVDDNGRWQFFLDTPTATEQPQSILISTSEESVEVKNILIGEVWLCSGQSNMEMRLRGFENQPVNGAQEALLRSNDPSLRLFTLEQIASSQEEQDCLGQWQESSPATAKEFSAVGYFYGRKLREVLRVPVGVIVAAWGGSPIESWIAPETLQRFDPAKLVSHEEDKPHRRHSALYHGMIAPLEPYEVKGILWYQGEANRFAPDLYQELFTAMIEDWRKARNKPELPFFFAQIAPYGDFARHIPEERKRSMELREAQLNTMLSVPGTGMAVTLDLGSKTLIHPPEKKRIAERLSYWAFNELYGFEAIAKSGPVFSGAEYKGGKAILHFDGAWGGLSYRGSRLDYFTVSGADEVFYPAQAQITSDGTVEVWSEHVENPIAVRYAWSRWTGASLFDGAGLPASSFRTDDW